MADRKKDMMRNAMGKMLETEFGTKHGNV